MGNYTLPGTPPTSKDVVVKIDHDKLGLLIAKAMRAKTGRTSCAHGAFTVLTATPAET